MKLSSSVSKICPYQTKYLYDKSLVQYNSHLFKVITFAVRARNFANFVVFGQAFFYRVEYILRKLILTFHCVIKLSISMISSADVN